MPTLQRRLKTKRNQTTQTKKKKNSLPVGIEIQKAGIALPEENQGISVAPQTSRAFENIVSSENDKTKKTKAKKKKTPPKKLAQYSESHPYFLREKLKQEGGTEGYLETRLQGEDEKKRLEERKKELSARLLDREEMEARAQRAAERLDKYRESKPSDTKDMTTRFYVPQKKQQKERKKPLAPIIEPIQPEPNLEFFDRIFDGMLDTLEKRILLDEMIENEN